jgi:hypothetical protein
LNPVGNKEQAVAPRLLQSTLLLGTLLFTLAGSPVVYSYDGYGDDLDYYDDEALILGDDFRITYDAEINANSMSGSALNLKGSYLYASIEWREKIRFAIKGKLEKLFDENGVSLADDFSLAEFITDAYIEIREINGTAMAIIIGKQPMAFGQNVQAMPLFHNNPLASLQEIKEVFGVTVDLREGIFGLFDQAELSVFETEAGDFSIGQIDGVSIRLSKMITDQILLTLSHAEMGNSHLNSGHERRTSVGLIGESTDGILVGWVEGMYFSNNPNYPNSSFGITVGGMMRVREAVDVVIEYNWIEKELSEIGLGVRTHLTPNVTLGAEVRYRNYVERDNDVIFGITLTYRFGNTPYSRNQSYLFGDDND